MEEEGGGGRGKEGKEDEGGGEEGEGKGKKSGWWVGVKVRWLDMVLLSSCEDGDHYI